MASTLLDVLKLAGLGYGVHRQNERTAASNREIMALKNADREMKRQQLQWQMEQERNRTKSDDADRTSRERIARAAQIRNAYTPLLQMGRTADEMAALSQNPEMFQALQQDKADIANLLASGDDAAWETFRPRFYGGQGFMPPPPKAQGGEPAAAGPPRGPFGMTPEPARPRGGMMGMGAPLPSAAAKDPLGNPLPPEMVSGPSVPLPQPGGASPWGPLGAPMGVTPDMAPSPQVPSWLRSPLPVSPKTAAGIKAQEAAAALAGERGADLKATRNPRIEKLKNDAALALKRGDYVEANTALTELKQLTEAERPALTRAITANVADQPKSRAATRDVQLTGIKTGAATARYATDTAAATAAAGRKQRQPLIDAQTGRLRLTNEALSRVSPQERPFVDAILKVDAETLNLGGVEQPLSEEDKTARRQQIADTFKQMYGRPLLGGGTAGGGAVDAPAVPAAPAAGGAQKFSSAQINAVARHLDAGTFEQLKSATDPSAHGTLIAVRQYVLSQRRARKKGRK